MIGSRVLSSSLRLYRAQGAQILPKRHFQIPAQKVVPKHWEKLSKETLKDPSFVANQIRHFSQQQLYPEALDMYFQHKSLHPGTPQLYNAVMGLCENTGNLLLASKIFNEMKQSENTKPTSSNLILYLTIHINARRMIEAVQVVREMEKATWMEKTVWCYNAMLNVYLKTRNFDEAFALFDKMKQQHAPTVSTYTMFIQAFLMYNETKLAIEAVQDMFREGLSPSHVTFHQILTHYAHVGRLQDAEDLFQIMKKNKIPLEVSLYERIISLNYDYGRLTRGNELMDEMRAAGFKPTPLLITKEREARNRSDKFDGFDE